jgi:hypothetical protein
VNTVVTEARVTLDARLLGENVVVLALEVGRDLLEAVSQLVLSVFRGSELHDFSPLVVVNAITKARGVDNSKRDAHTILLKLDVDGLDLDGATSVRVSRGLQGEVGVDLGARVLRVAQERLRPVRQEGLLDERVDERGAASARRACW